MDASTSRGVARRARARRFRYRHGWHRLLGARSRPSDRHGTDLLSLRRGAGHLPTRRPGSPAADALSVKGGGRPERGGKAMATSARMARADSSRRARARLLVLAMWLSVAALGCSDDESPKPRTTTPPHAAPPHPPTTTHATTTPHTKN